MWLVCFGFWGKGGWVWEVEIIRLGIEILGSGSECPSAEKTIRQNMKIMTHFKK